MPHTVIKENLLVLKGNLGEGGFGYVKKATLAKSLNKLLDVALKFFFHDGLKEELAAMSKLKNKYIIQLYGISRVKGERCLVMEYMNQGCLLDFVRKNSKKLLKELAFISVLLEDVSRGMEYLSGKGFVHRDLAARNILVHLDAKNILRAKIADFGLTRDDTYYRSEDVNAFAWMPLEVHDGHGHTRSSDVWSYAIVCWEAYSFGREPFSGLRMPQVRKILKTMDVPLKCPKHCPRSFYEVMKKCWKSDPKKRIRFSTIVREIRKMNKESQKKNILFN